MNTKTITIADHEFAVIQPYAEGHTITEAEAKALNQVRAENIRNNMASKVKVAFGEAPTEELNPQTIAAYVEKYDSEYVFTMASVGAGKRPVDPVEVEALRIARSMFTEWAKSKKLTVKEVVARIGDDAYNAKLAEIAARDDVVKEAKRRVKVRTERAASAMDDLGLGDMLPTGEEAAA